VSIGSVDQKGREKDPSLALFSLAETGGTIPRRWGWCASARWAKGEGGEDAPVIGCAESVGWKRDACGVRVTGRSFRDRVLRSQARTRDFLFVRSGQRGEKFSFCPLCSHPAMKGSGDKAPRGGGRKARLVSFRPRKSPL